MQSMSNVQIKLAMVILFIIQSTLNVCVDGKPTNIQSMVKCVVCQKIRMEEKCEQKLISALHGLVRLEASVLVEYKREVEQVEATTKVLTVELC